jgi:HJR/Mrr/RecB family endonuclease
MAGYRYRAYIFGIGAQFLWAVALVCPNDEIAKEQARQLADGHEVELWQGDHKIETFKDNHG